MIKHLNRYFDLQTLTYTILFFLSTHYEASIHLNTLHILFHLTITTTPKGRYYCPYFTDRETKVQRSEIICPKLHGLYFLKLEVNSGLSNSKAQLLMTMLDCFITIRRRRRTRRKKWRRRRRNVLVIIFEIYW